MNGLSLATSLVLDNRTNTPKKESPNKIFQKQVLEINNLLIDFTDKDQNLKNHYNKIPVKDFFNEYKNLVNLYLKIYSKLKNINIDKDNHKTISAIKETYIIISNIILGYSNYIGELFGKDLDSLEVENEDEIFLNYMSNHNTLLFDDKELNNSNFEEKSEKNLELDKNIKIFFKSLSEIGEQYSDILILVQKDGNTLPYDFLLDIKYKRIFNYILEIAKDIKISNSSKKLLIHIISENYKYIFFDILADSRISDKEKIKNIKTSYQEILENNFNFDFRNELSNIFGKIFKNNDISLNLFLEIHKTENGNPNRNIRLEFIENHPHFNEIYSFVQENVIGRRAIIEYLKRLEKEYLNTKNDLYLDEFIKYKTILTERIDNGDKSHSSKDAEKKYSDFIDNTKIKIPEKTIEQTSNKVEKTIKPNEKIKTNFKTKIIHEKEFEILLIKGEIKYKEINDILENKKNKFKKSNIFNIIVNYYNGIFIKQIINLEFFDETNKEKLIFNYIKEQKKIGNKINLKNLFNIIEILELNIDKKELLILLYDKNYSLNQIINIIGNSYFSDIILDLHDDDGKINQINSKIFFLYENFGKIKLIQHIGFFNKYREEFEKNYKINTNNKKIEIIRIENGEPKKILEIKM